MIERLPLDLFGDRDDDAATTETPADAEDLLLEEPAEADAENADADIVLVSCQWCSESFDNALSHCPACNALHVKTVVPEEVTSTTCQWCHTVFDIGPTECPTCNARVIVPGQNVPGEHDIPLDYARLGIMSQRAQSRQLLVGMMAGGGIDGIAAGLIGLAVTLLDD